MDQYPAWGARNPSQNTTNLLSFVPSVSLIRGKHSIRVGADLRDIRANAKGGSFLWGSGQFTFNRTFTQRVPGFDDGTGNAVASLLLGYPTGGVVQYVPELAYRWGYYGFYFNNDFKVSQRLTLNLGLRWDYEGVPTERYNRMNAGFGFDQASPLAAAARAANPSDCPACANLTGGLLFVDQNNREPFSRDYNNWQPRIGAAYRLFDRTVLSGGYGIFYLPEASYGGSAGFASDSPFIATQGGGIQAFTPFISLTNPYPTGLIDPTGANTGLATFQGRNVIFANREREIGYVHSYSFGLQHQLPANIVIDASFVGSRTMSINTNSNQAGGARNLNGATLQRRQLLLPYPQFGEVRMALEPVGKLWYDSLQVQVEKRYSAGLTLVGSYTWSKNIEALSFLNDQDAEPAKVLAATDRPHRFVVSGVYQLPFGRGRKLGSGANRAVDAAIGGWEYNFIGNIQSGTPMNLPGNFDLIGDPRLDTQTFNQWFNACSITLAGQVRQPNATHSGFESCSTPVWRQRDTNVTLRTTPLRSPNIRNPWAKQWDMSLVKNFRFTERVHAQFRAEGFNVFNTPIRPEPNVDPNNTQAGFISVNQRNFPRQVQLGFKLNF